MMSPRYQGFVPPVGYHDFHPDVSINFQCNRWYNWIGEDSFEEIKHAATAASSYPEWIEAYLALAEKARKQGRELAAAYYDRAAEFFMVPTDDRKRPARQRFIGAIRKIFDVTPDEIRYEDGKLFAYDLRPAGPPAGTVLAFGGYDSYIEEFLPLLSNVVQWGFRVVTFDGPGQGSALEESGLPLTHMWERPTSAILDHYGLDDVTAIGISLGGGLVIRAAAFEPRIRRVVANDIFDDELEALGRQIAPGVTPAIRALLALRARSVINTVAWRAAARKPVSQWGIAQGMHITGAGDPYDFIAAARTVNTHTISDRVTADVLLLAGADDHYVPLHQLQRQAAALTNARSVTTRIFTAQESASNHCQIGNLGLLLRTVAAWIGAVAPDQIAAVDPATVNAILSGRELVGQPEETVNHEEAGE